MNPMNDSNPIAGNPDLDADAETVASPETGAASTVVGGIGGGDRFDAPIREVLLRLGHLNEDQATRVVAHAAERGLDFDQAALELGFITTEELDRAREQLINSMALQNVARRPVSDELVVISDPGSVRAETIRMLRTQVIAQHIKNGRRGLAVVAAADGHGCSYVTANLAASLAQVGFKVLLVDANMRSPRQDQIFGVDPNAPGLSSFLTLQAARPERVVNANVLPGLALITAGPPTSRPQELLSGNRFRDGVNTLLREYDLVLFDTPAANTNADALNVGGAAGYALIVGRANETYYKDIDTLSAQLAAARCAVVGAVLNEF
jgi:capsular exopolysaccharide synthesis family protein